ncbi:hypothetical protein ACE3MQ_26180 [Paenibacillus lentus]|uniref:hypothetical protein n=1 Tax=Paenibacillus lentus TaxID=1338368 RepID=UPI0036615DCA
MEESKPFIVNRNSHKPEQAEEKFEKNLEEIQKITTNEVLASQFPEWDLKPPATLIKRRSNKFL